MERIEDVKTVGELIRYMEDNDLIIAPRQLIKEQQLKEKILRKKWITLKEIADSKIWGVKKDAVKLIVKKEVDPDCIDAEEAPFKIHRSEVERIAKNRGTL